MIKNFSQKFSKLILILFYTVVVFIPIFIIVNPEGLTSLGYLGFVLSSYLGGVLLLIPIFLKLGYNPIILLLVSSFGGVADEAVGWYAGLNLKQLVYMEENWLDKLLRLLRFKFNRQTFSDKISGYVQRYGLKTVFVMSLLPLPNSIYSISALAAGYYKLPFKHFFIVNFAAKFIRNLVIVGITLYYLF